MRWRPFLQRARYGVATALAGGYRIEDVKGAEFYQELNEMSDIQLFAGSGSMEFAREVCAHLGLTLGRLQLDRFSDGEVKLEIVDEVRGRDVYLVHSSLAGYDNRVRFQCEESQSARLHGSIMELLLMISAVRRSSAKRITAVLPYLSYSRQTIQGDAHRPQPLSGADMCSLLLSMGVDRVIFVDLHNQRMEGFFEDSLPVANLLPYGLAVHYFANRRPSLINVMVISARTCGGDRAQEFWMRLKKAGVQAGLTSMVKSAKNEYGVVGDVRNCDCIVVDDVVDTGEDINSICKKLKEAGARQIFFYATHAAFSKDAPKIIASTPSLTQLVVTNSIPSEIVSDKIQVLSIGRLVAEAVRKLHSQQSVTALYSESDCDRINWGSRAPQQ